MHVLVSKIEHVHLGSDLYRTEKKSYTNATEVNYQGLGEASIF